MLIRIRTRPQRYERYSDIKNSQGVGCRRYQTSAGAASPILSAIVAALIWRWLAWKPPSLKRIGGGSWTQQWATGSHAETFQRADDTRTTGNHPCSMWCSVGWTRRAQTLAVEHTFPCRIYYGETGYAFKMPWILLTRRALSIFATNSSEKLCIT